MTLINMFLANIFHQPKRSKILFYFLIILIIGVGVFLRTWHFSSWLHFEIDQTYDTNIVSRAVSQGIGNLPLLGPTSGGGRALRLGPAFYYAEYLSAKTFGDTPTGHAMLVLICSLASLPLFFLLCRKYFTSIVSLGLLALYSFSFYLVAYGRFSWSPDVLPFLIILFSLLLLRSTDENEPKKQRYFLWSVAVLTVITQIHFNTFFIVPATFVIFLIIVRPKFSWRTWLGALAIVLTIYSPVILSEYKTRGQDFKDFLSKTKKPTHINKDSLVTKQTFSYFSLDEALILTGQDHINFRKSDNAKFFFLNNTLPPEKTFILIAYSIWLICLIILIFNCWRIKDRQKRNFLLLQICLNLFAFLYFFAIGKSFRLFPRFFLPIAPSAIILFGLFLERLRPDKNLWRKIFFWIIIAILIYSNGIEMKKYFSFLENPESLQAPVETEDVFPNIQRATLENQLQVTNYIFSQYQKNCQPIFIKTKSEFDPVFWYHLKKLGVKYFGPAQAVAPHSDADYFLIQRKLFPLDANYAGNWVTRFDLKEKKNFGAFVVYYLRAKDLPGNASPLNEADRKVDDETDKIEHLYTWKKLFNNERPDEPANLENDTSEEDPN